MTVRKTPVVRRVAPPGPGQRLPAPSHTRGTRRARSHAHSTRTAHRPAAAPATRRRPRWSFTRRQAMRSPVIADGTFGACGTPTSTTRSPPRLSAHPRLGRLRAKGAATPGGLPRHPSAHGQEGDGGGGLTEGGLPRHASVQDQEGDGGGTLAEGELPRHASAHGHQKWGSPEMGGRS